MKVMLKTSITRFVNDSFKVYKKGEVVDLPLAEAQRMVELRRAVAVEETVVEAPADDTPTPKPTRKRVL